VVGVSRTPEELRNTPASGYQAGAKRVRGDLVYFQYRVLVDYDGQQHRSDDLHDNRGIECLHDLRAARWLVITVRKDSTREWVRDAIEVALRSRAGTPESDQGSTCAASPAREWARMAPSPCVKGL
jgi:hypothetical protein